MLFDMKALPPKARYKLLTGVVIPRPIAWTTTVNADGQVNAAPMSFFNLMGYDPPVVVLGVGNRSVGRPKDTAHNIRETGVFVVNIVDESLAEQMNLTSGDYPPGVSEVEAGGLATAPTVAVDVPRLADAPASLECREVTTLLIGNNRLIVGEVLYLHIRESLVDTERLYVDGAGLQAIGRMHGRGWYTRTRDLFQMVRPTLASVTESE